MAAEFFLVRPAYTHTERADGDVLLQEQPPGTVMGWDVEPGDEGSVLSSTIVEARRKRPECAPVIRLAPELEGDLDLARRFGLLEIRAILRTSRPLERQLRRALATPPDPGARVAQWLQLFESLHGDVQRFIRACFEAGAREDVVWTCGVAHVDPGELRRQIAGTRLPAAEDWVRLPRLLRAALRLQEEPDAGTARVALEAGFYGQSAFGVALKESFGYTPRELRRLLGWEWLVLAWMRRAKGDASAAPRRTTWTAARRLRP